MNKYKKVRVREDRMDDDDDHDDGGWVLEIVGSTKPSQIYSYLSIEVSSAVEEEMAMQRCF